MPVGNIRCSKCHKATKKAVCSCGYSFCYISLYWKSRQYRFFRYNLDGDLFNYKRASKQLTDMNLDIEKKTFNPLDCMSGAI